jgi:NADH:ubiquinone oxidoreductase subunit 4 (subunit M)
MFIILNGDLVVIPFIFVTCLGVFDVVPRLIVQTDLKAITAYCSVLHINLLLLLFLLDTVNLSSGLILYIWGHSYATAGIFLVINLIERTMGSRATFEVTGIYMVNTLIAIFAVFALITFLEFPLCFFFWGEF